MKVKTVSYSMLRVVAQFENDRAEVTIELEEGDSHVVAIERAKRLCREALGGAQRERELERELELD